MPRRIPTWAVLPVLVVLLGAAAVLTLHAASAGPFSTRQPAVAPAAPTARRAGGAPALSPSRPTPSSNQTGATATPRVLRGPRGSVQGIVAQAPMIGRFVLVAGGTHQPDKLLWDTHHAGRVTLNGVPVAAHGTLLVHGAVAGAAYQLDARDGARLVTAQVRVPPGGAARPASAAPVALLNVNAITLSARAGNGPSEEQTIRIVNLGPGSLTVTSVALGGQAPQNFRVRTTCTNSPLPVDGGCTISVAFMPTGRGVRTAALIVGDNTAASPHTIVISGRAT